MKVSSTFAFASLLIVGFNCDQTLNEPQAGSRRQAARSLPALGTLDGDPVETLLPPDAIRAIDTPQFVPAGQAGFMRAEEPVVGLLIDGVAKAYSTWYLDHHEIVNDTIAGSAVAVTW